MVDMRDLGDGTGRTAGASALSAPTVAEIETFVHRLAADAGGLGDAERIDRIAALESLRCATEAAQSETVADFVVSQRRVAAERGVPAERRDRGLAAQVALARGVCPRSGVSRTWRSRWCCAPSCPTPASRSGEVASTASGPP
jgi:hypothetical protein